MSEDTLASFQNMKFVGGTYVADPIASIKADGTVTYRGRPLSELSHAEVCEGFEVILRTWANQSGVAAPEPKP